MACVYAADATAEIAGNTVRLPPLRSTRPEAAAVAQILGGVPGFAAGAQILDSHRISAAELGSLLRNSSVAHVAAHGLVAVSTRIEPPAIHVVAEEPALSPADPDLRTLGDSYARHRGQILEVRLTGTPEQIGSCCYFLASPPAEFINGIILPVVGKPLPSM